MNHQKILLTVQSLTLFFIFPVICAMIGLIYGKWKTGVWLGFLIECIVVFCVIGWYWKTNKDFDDTEPICNKCGNNMDIEGFC